MHFAKYLSSAWKEDIKTNMRLTDIHIIVCTDFVNPNKADLSEGSFSFSFSLKGGY